MKTLRLHFLIPLALVTIAAGCHRANPTAPTTTPGPAGSSSPSGSAAVTLRGFVSALNGTKWTPIAGATVHFIVDALPGADFADMLTDNGGAFHVDGLPTGLVSLQVAHEDYLTTTVTTVSPNALLGIMLFPKGHPVETVAVGDSVVSSVSTDDPHCDTADPNVEELESPCKTFQLTASRSGTLTADLTWNSTNIFMELLTPWLGKCCRSPLRLQFPVTVGQTYNLSVGFHGTTGAGPEGIALFDLATSLTP